MKKELINHAITLLTVITLLLTLLIIGAEPSEMGEAGLERYYADLEKWGPLLLGSWLVSAGVLVTLVIVKAITSSKNQK